MLGVIIHVPGSANHTIRDQHKQPLLVNVQEHGPGRPMLPSGCCLQDCSGFRVFPRVPSPTSGTVFPQVKYLLDGQVWTAA